MRKPCFRKKETRKLGIQPSIQNRYSLTHLHQITEDHVFELKQYLQGLSKMRTDAEPIINARIAQTKSEKEKWELHLELKRTGMAPATARSYFRNFRTLFNRLEVNKKLLLIQLRMLVL